MAKPKAITETNPHIIAYKMAKLGCNIDEIADCLAISRHTCHERYRDDMTKGRAEGKRSVRRMLWKAAQIASHKGSEKALLLLAEKELDYKTANTGNNVTYVKLNEASSDTLERDVLEIRNLLDSKPKSD